MANHIVVTGTTISEWTGNDNYRNTLFVREAYCDQQSSKRIKPQTNHHPPQKAQGNKITFLTAWQRLSIYLQEVSWLAPVPQFPFANMAIIDITSYIVLRTVVEKVSQNLELGA